MIMSHYTSTEKYSYQKINRFFVEQIPRLETPIINDKHNCVSVGPYRVITNGKLFEVWQSRRMLYEFSRRSWGVGYAVCMYRRDNKTAAQLIDIDQQYTRLDQERYIYKHHIDVSKESNNTIRKGILECRLSRTDNEIFTLEQQAKNILKNIHIV